MNALLITLGVYAIPNNGYGLIWFFQVWLCCLIYTALIYKYTKRSVYMPLIGIEFFSLACIITSYVSFQITGQQNFVSAHIVAIINACFLCELIIAGWSAFIGIRQRIYSLWSSRADDDSCRRSALHFI